MVGGFFRCFQQQRKEQGLYSGLPVLGVQIVERGRKIDEEKENDVFFPSFSPKWSNSLRPSEHCALLPERLEQAVK